MRCRVSKWGHSLALRIPSHLVKELELEVGQEVDFEVNGERLIVIPDRKPEYSLSHLLSGVTDENRHGEMDTGPQQGREQW